MADKMLKMKVSAKKPATTQTRNLFWLNFY